MRRLAQFVRLRASRVSRLSASVSRLRAFVSRASRVCVHLSRVRLASVCVCSRQGFRMRASASASVSRLASVVLSRICLRASVSRLSRVGRLVSRLCVCICLASVSRRSSCLASVSRRSSCLASVCLLVNACGNWLILCVGRHSKSSKGFCYRHTIAVHIDYVDYMNRPLIF